MRRPIRPPHRVSQAATAVLHLPPSGPALDGPSSSNGHTAGTTTTIRIKTWPVLDKPAYHGLAGEAVTALSPPTESDPAALFVQYLITFSHVVTPHPF